MCSRVAEIIYISIEISFTTKEKIYDFTFVTLILLCLKISLHFLHMSSIDNVEIEGDYHVI